MGIVHEKIILNSHNTTKESTGMLYGFYRHILTIKIMKNEKCFHIKNLKNNFTKVIAIFFVCLLVTFLSICMMYFIQFTLYYP